MSDLKKQKELSDRRNECAYAIVGFVMAIVNSVDDHSKRQRLRELIERFEGADSNLDDFYRQTEIAEHMAMRNRGEV